MLRLICVFALATSIIGCGDDDGGGNADATSSNDSAAAADAMASIDAAPDAAVAGTATITVQAGAANPIGGVDVVWFDSAGAVLDHEATNITGKASHEILPGSAVTLAIMAGPTRFTVTYLDIKPGDDLVWDFGGGGGGAVSDLEIDLPGTFAGATRYEINWGCGSANTNNPNTTITGNAIQASCLGSDNNIDGVAVAYQGDTPVAYDHVTGVAVSSGGTTTMTFDAWQTATDPLDVTLTNLPADVMGAGLDTNIRIDGLDFPGPSGGGAVSNGSVTINTGYYQGFPSDPVQYTAFLGRGTVQNPEGISIVLAQRTGKPAAVTHDLSNLLPTVTNVAAATASDQLELSWTASGSLASADGILLLTSWTDSATNYTSYVMAPPGSSSPLLVPKLPEDLASFRPTGTAVFQTPTFIVTEADFVNGYDEYRPDGWRIFGDANGWFPAGDGFIRAHLGGQLPGGGGGGS